MAILMPEGKQSFTNDAGVPLAGGKLYTYAAGTTTPKTTWADSAQTASNTNPIILDARGEATIFWNGAYKVELRTPLDVVIWTVDNVTASSDPTLRADLAASGGSALVGFVQATGVARTVQAKLRETFSVRDYGAVGDGVTDDTTAIQAAINAAHVDGGGLVKATPGIYIVNGTLVMQAGVSLVGENYASEYYIGSPYGEVDGTMFKKPAGGTNGPIVEMATASAVHGIYFQHLKVGGANEGIIRMGVSANSGDIYNAVVQDCQLYGHAIAAGVYAAASCHGIYSPESTIAPTHQRYFCRITNVYITNCDRGLHLGGQSNGWSVTNLLTRQTYRPIYLDGGASEVADTLVTGLNAQAIGTLPTAVTAVITMVGAVNVFKVSGISECNGKAYDVTGATSYNQVDFSDYVPNEPIPSDGTVPFSIQISGYAPSTLRGPTGQQLITDPSRTGDALTQGYGIRHATGTKVSGTLPQLAGAVFDTSVNSKCVVQMPASVLSKAAKASFSAKLKVFLSTPAAGGLAVADVDFIYRVTNQSTGAAMLSVERTVLKGGQIVALGFVSGKTAGTGFRIGVTGATGGAVVANALTVVLEIDAVTYDANIIAMNDFDNIAYVSTTPTADDVTDFVSLLAVADTVI